MNKVLTSYLEKHKPFTSFNVGSIIKTPMIVVIPVYLEDKLESTLDSLLQCHAPQQNVAVLLVVNAAVHADEEVILQQKNTITMLSSYVQGSSEWLRFYVVEALDLPKKHFGAGLARKIGMDLAVQHFLATENDKGIIVSLDADTTVDQNYFQALYDYFNTTEHNACSIYFEHPTQGDSYDEAIYDAITQYELHLRYYVESLRMIGFPYAFHTVGSCFATTANAYVKVGGMNRRQGGEEFYFIQKLIQIGGYGELNSTVVHPSPRISDRVPFGTGPSVKNIVHNQQEYMTYHLQGFLDLKVLFDHIEDYYKISEETYQQEILKLPGRVRSFLLNSFFWVELSNLMGNCSSLKVFKKRFYEIFNAFRLVKYINYIHEHFVDKTPVFDAAIDLLQILDYDTDDYFEEKELLFQYRKMQRL